MPRVVDGDNLLGTWPGRRRSDADKRELVQQVDRLIRREKRRIVVVFDGTAPPGVSYGADVVFAGAGRSADAVILDILRNEKDPRGFTVVTNDRSLADQCRFMGASIEGVKPFRERLERGDAKEKPDNVTDVDYWLEQFKDE